MGLLSKAITGRIDRPYKILVHGRDGVGKTTFGAASDRPLILCGERGSEELEAARWECREWSEFWKWLQAVRDDKHDYKTLVIETVDWFYKLAYLEVLKERNWTECPGYGKADGLACDKLETALRIMELIRDRGVNILLLAHTDVVNFNDVNGVSYPRYEPSLPKKARATVLQWPSAVLFAHYETASQKVANHRTVGVTSGKRVLETHWHAQWDAKHRYGLPKQLPLDYAAFEAAYKESRNV